MRHFIHYKKNNSSFDIVHLSGPKSNYTITENGGTLFYAGKDTKNQYDITEVEKFYWSKGTTLKSTWAIEYAGFATTLNKLDIFNDGSCIAAYMLDKPIEMLSTNSLPNGSMLVLELNGDSFTDTTGKIITTDGTTIDTNIKKSGTGSMRFSNDSSVTLPTSNDFILGTGDFTIECDFNLSVNGSYGALILEGRPTGTNGTYLVIGVDTTRKFGCFANNAVIVTSNKVLNLNTWYHLVCQRKNGVFSLYIDGVFENSATSVLNFTRNTFVLGRNAFVGAGGWTPWTGNIDNFRIVKNSSLYTNVVADLSGNYNGIPTNITYGVGKFGQCAVFNGVSSYISLPTTFINNYPFTFSCWTKTSKNIDVNQYLFNFMLPGQSGARFSVSHSGSTTKSFLIAQGGQPHFYSPSVIQSNLSHIVVVAGALNNYKLYIDGNSIPLTNAGGGYMGSQWSLGTNRIGDDNRGYFYEGSFDTIRIFNKALTQSEVTKLFNEK